MLWFAALPLAMASILWALFGPKAVLFFFVQSWMAFTLLELVNYVEHYGLTRKKLAGDCYERVTHRHSWNAADSLTNCFLIHLQRHADHHAHPTRRYQALMHYDDSPQLPTGYSGMVMLALLPPLWFAVMNPRVEAFLHRGESP
jgi:alkane 1-monooxygenase